MTIEISGTVVVAHIIRLDSPCGPFLLESLGPNRVVVTAEESIGPATGESAGPLGPRVIVDAVMGPTLTDLADLVALRGTIIAYGALHPDARTTAPFAVHTV